MKQLFLKGLLLFSTLCGAQELSKWVPAEAEQYPARYLQQLKKAPPASGTKDAGRLFAIGKCYENLNQEDSAFKYFIKCRQLLTSAHNNSLASEVSFEIHTLISSQENYDRYGNIFLKEYHKHALKTKSPLKLGKALNEFGKEFLVKYDTDKNKNTAWLDTADTYFLKARTHFKQARSYAHIANSYNGSAAVSVKLGNMEKAITLLDSARAYSVKIPDTYEYFINTINKGNVYFVYGDYKKAITWFKKAEQIPLTKYREKSLRLLYKKLMECYDALNDQPNRRTYQKLYLELEAKINDEKQNIAIHETEQKYRLDEKDKEISALQNFREKFNKNRLVYTVLLFLVFLMALYSFVRWKKVDYYKKKLQTEKLQVQEEKQVIEEVHLKTVEELEKVKKIVNEGHIILKDNTKVYLADLMYVKAEDHYLNLYSKDGKKHFVRGKISDILNELPPNFLKCHRSYIVNTNYINTYGKGAVILKNREKIPVSRNFKF